MEYSEWMWPAAGLAFVLLWWLRQRGLASVEQVREMMAADAIVVDVRTAGEYQHDHIEGAVNIPLHQLRDRAPAQLSDPQQPVLVYCLSGTRSGSGKRKLLKLGYTRVLNMGSVARARSLLQQAAATA